METLLIGTKVKEEKKTAKQRRKEEFLDSLPGRLQEVERGEIKLKSAYNLLNEL